MAHLFYNYPRRGGELWWIYRDDLALVTEPKGDSCVCFVVNNKYTAVTNGFKLCSLLSVHTHMGVRNLLQKYSSYDE